MDYIKGMDIFMGAAYDGNGKDVEVLIPFESIDHFYSDSQKETWVVTKSGKRYLAQKTLEQFEREYLSEFETEKEKE